MKKPITGDINLLSFNQKERKKRSIEEKKALWGWVFVLPALLFFMVFSFYPMMNAFYLSLTRYNLISLEPPKFIWFKNYVYLFQSPEFWNSLKSTAIFTLGTFLLLLVFSLALGAFIISRKKGRTLLQMIFYSPALLSSVVAALIWFLIFDPRGLANQFVNFVMGTPGVDHKWLATAGMLRLSTIIVYFWKYIGYFTIIFVAGMGNIPQSIHEAAAIDGTNKWQHFWLIVFPLIKPTTLLVSVMAMLQCLKTFSTQYLFTTSGAPTKPINVITLNIYNTAIRDFRIDRASAMSVLLFLIMLVLSWLQFKAAKERDISYM
ncbi:MAG: sugar ABC transporter permease [Firmicutes bacterium]|nr:sugar ABC transporter permease [Bacillota bacterium]